MPRGCPWAVARKEGAGIQGAPGTQPSQPSQSSYRGGGSMVRPPKDTGIKNLRINMQRPTCREHPKKSTKSKMATFPILKKPCASLLPADETYPQAITETGGTNTICWCVKIAGRYEMLLASEGAKGCPINGGRAVDKGQLTRVPYASDVMLHG